MSILRKFSLLLLLTSASAVQAAEVAPPPIILYVTSYMIHPGAAPMFEQLVQRCKAAAEKLGNRPTWAAYSPGIGNDLQYNFASPVTSFGMFADMSDDVFTAFGMEEAQKTAAMAKESIAGIESYVVMSRADLGIAAPERETPHEMVFAYSIVVKPGKNAEWEATMEKVIEASNKVAPGVFWNTYQGTIAAPNLYMIRVNLDWTDMDTPIMPVPARLKAAFGDKKGERIWQDNIEVVESLETSLSRFRLDLSHLPQS